MPPYREVAFFDVDGTLLADKSLISFHLFMLERQFPDDWRPRTEAFTALAARKFAEGMPRDQLNAWYYETYFGGMDIAKLRALGERWFVESKSRNPAFLVRPMIDLLQRHKGEGRAIVLVTGSCRELVLPLARGLDLDITDSLMAPLEERDGVYTGKLTASAMIGEGKAHAVRRFLSERSLSAEDCYGYGDDHTDIPFLDVVGHPVAVPSSTQLLLEHARSHGWQILA